MVKKYVHKPRFDGAHWVVKIADSPSPFANILEEIKFGCQASAHSGYAKIKRELGEWN